MIKFLKSPLAFQIISALFCIYVTVARLGDTGSYKDAFDAASMFAAIWLLGHYSVEGGK